MPSKIHMYIVIRGFDSGNLKTATKIQELPNSLPDLPEQSRQVCCMHGKIFIMKHEQQAFRGIADLHVAAMMRYNAE